MDRSSGILLHISSLPSPYGIGTLGKDAREFAKFLASAGQRYWQVLPVGPTGYGDSPYQSFSAFAGNPYFIDLDALSGDGLLEKREYTDEFWGDDVCCVDYTLLYEKRLKVLETAFDSGYCRDRAIVDDMSRKCFWLDDYALFMALKEHFDGTVWNTWPVEGLVMRDRGTLALYARKLARRVEFYKYLQYLFFRQWRALRSFVNGLGVRIIGDIPIYVAMDSADTWASPEQFDLDLNRNPVCVAGCPPDYFSKTGQLWGNPLYAWDVMEKDGYSWWIRRIKAVMDLYDMVRIDHFRAFDTFYAIPYGQDTAEGGEWRKGPGLTFFQSVNQALGELPIIAEDLGYLFESVHELRKNTGLPGMKLLEFAFDSNEKNDYLPHSYERNCAVYTGTHDNDTVMGWMEHAPEGDALHAKAYMALNEREGFNWGFIRTAFGSVANLAVAQMQDVLGLGSEARMNVPSTLGGNWTWRMAPGAFTAELASRLRGYTEMYER